MKIQLKRSNVLESNAAKAPTAEQMEYGELAVNYNEEDPTIFLKDSNNNIIRIAGAGAEGANDVIVSATTPSTADLVEGQLWWNSDSTSGKLFVLYNDPSGGGGTDAGGLKWVETSPTPEIPTIFPDLDDGNNQPGTLDDRYLSTEADAGNQTVESTGTTTFNGSGEFGGGIEVSGGNPANIDNGLGLVTSGPSGDQGLYLTSNDKIRLDSAGIIRFDGETANAQFGNNAAVLNGRVSIDFSNNIVNGAAFGCDNFTFTGSAATDTFTCYRANARSNSQVTNAPGTVYGFSVLSNLTGLATDNVYGFHTNLSQNNDQNRFNFYAAGTAPNFFKGSTYIGGTAFRNTRELWESTLTEEQKEELAAGTLAIPANVSTPGDGSFVRQWWYDQQSAEDRALIDAGELEYPERYQAANFVDTFVLGADTNIDLLSTGEISAKNLTLATNSATSRSDIALSGNAVFGYAENVSFAGEKASEVRFRFADGDTHDSAAGTANTTTVHRIDKEYIVPNAIKFRTDSLDFETGNQITAAEVECGIIRRTTSGEQAIQIVENGTANFAVNPNTISSNNKYYAARGFGGTSTGSGFAYVASSTLPAGLDANFTSFSSQLIVEGSQLTVEGDETSDIQLLRHFYAHVTTWDDWKAEDVIEEQYGVTVSSNLSPDGEQYNNIKKTYGVHSNISNRANRENYNFYAAGTAPNYFRGLVESLGGVKVTGGAGGGAPTIQGIASNPSGTLFIASEPNNRQSINFQVAGETVCSVNTLGRFDSKLSEKFDTTNIIGFQTTGRIDGDDTSSIESIQSYRADGSITNQLGDTGYPNSRIDGSGFYATNNYGKSSASDSNRSANRLLTYAGFKAQNILDGALTTYGFYSDVGTSSNTTHYNFYAEGDAPNYFAGNVACSNTFSSNNPGLNNTETGCVMTPGGRLYGSHGSAPALNGNTNNAGKIVSLRYQGSEVGSITTDGANISILGQTSDYRVKKDVTPLSSTVNIIKGLNVVEFKYTDRGNDEIRKGFIAHELQEAGIPEAVFGTKDATEAIGTLYDFDGTVLETGVVEPPAEEQSYLTEEGETRVKSWTATGTRPIYQGVDQTKLIPLLTKALQETLDKIEVLEQRLSDAGIA